MRVGSFAGAESGVVCRAAGRGGGAEILTYPVCYRARTESE